MTNLRGILDSYVGNTAVCGAVGLVACGDQVEVQAVGSIAADGSTPMARDSIFRLASTTKPITAAAVMLLVQDGKITLDDPIANWLPELAAPADLPLGLRIPGRLHPARRRTAVR
jgi:CubicO group peptidase (beta-lactamase class C family)